MTRLSANCWGADFHIVLPRSGVVWGGWAEVRCVDTHSEVWTLVRGRAHKVGSYEAACLRHGTDFRGLATDGSAAYYALLDVGGITDCEPWTPDSAQGKCSYDINGGAVYRVARGQAVQLRRLPATALIAASPGRIATISPAPHRGNWNLRGQLDFPRAARNATVEVRRIDTGAVVARFAPAGTVRAIAIADHDAAVLVETGGKLRLEWYAEDTGHRAGVVAVPAATDRRLSLSDGKLLFSVGKTLLLLNLRSGAQQVLWRGVGNVQPVDPSIMGNRIVWGVDGIKRARILMLTLP